MTYPEAYERATFVPEHYNVVARATVPECWEVRDRKGRLIGLGDTREDAAAEAAGYWRHGYPRREDD